MGTTALALLLKEFEVVVSIDLIWVFFMPFFSTKEYINDQTEFLPPYNFPHFERSIYFCIFLKMFFLGKKSE